MPSSLRPRRLASAILLCASVLALGATPASAADPTAADTAAPTVPTGLRVERSVDLTTVDLTWTASTDDVGVVGYEVLTGDEVVATSTQPRAELTELTTAPYTFSVRARDAAGNLSERSVAVLSTGPSCACLAYRYSASGTTSMKTVTKGVVPLKGTFDMTEFRLLTGAFKADLALQPASVRLIALGMLPVTAKLTFVSSGRTQGQVRRDAATGRFAFSSKTLTRIKLPEVKLFGTLPIERGTTCQTRSLSTVELSAPDFNVLTGGTVSAGFAIGDLSGCGALNGLVSPQTAGDATLKLTLTGL